MHIVTFYSYKGGVGRTMALVNAAIVLAQSGRKVLIVDFDLEAPGISTYGPLSCLTSTKGVVEYVSEYVETATAPKAQDFIVASSLGEANVWAMPAGRRNRDYANRLNSIDWQSLYALQSGYLFFEDLKQQWRSLGFDYVLIDSRTGHTDVGGICTRQLPDAVVLMFFPNDQNLIGLESVVRDIREEPRRLRRKDIILHFCASNVPDLDDEDHILERKLMEARKSLGCRSNPALIHHYNSLTLLEQSLFVLDRPKSRLAAEYRSLVDLIVSQNLEDPKGAIAELRRLRNEIRKVREDGGEEPVFDSQLKEIRDLHPGNGEVAWLMAQIYGAMGNLDEETRSLTVAIETGVNVVTARRRRASIARLQSRPEDALVDLHSVLANERTPGVEFVAALELLRDFDSNWISVVANAPSLWKLDDHLQMRVVEILESDVKGTELAIAMMSKLVDQPREVSELANLHLTLALIRSRQFKKAIEAIAGSREEVLESNEPIDVFNYAMAEWGQKGIAPKDLMARVLLLLENVHPEGVNRRQCLALANYVCGEINTAKHHLQMARRSTNDMTGREFSCWRYLEVSRNDMRKDLGLMEDYIDGVGPGPTVFATSGNELLLN
jgi:cellulose biosynthesis protein BcsQ